MTLKSARTGVVTAMVAITLMFASSQSFALTAGELQSLCLNPEKVTMCAAYTKGAVEAHRQSLKNAATSSSWVATCYDYTYGQVTEDGIDALAKEVLNLFPGTMLVDGKRSPKQASMNAAEAIYSVLVARCLIKFPRGQ